jgi:hypothetical protein
MMKLTLRSMPACRHLAARSRAGERGAAVFVVVLVIAMLTTIGLFAARSASLSTNVSGHSRQMTQTHYLTEYAMLTALSELSSDARSSYLDKMTQANSRDDCATLVTQNVSNRTCFIFSYNDVQTSLGMPLAAPNGTQYGSFGPADVQPDFVIEMTDLSLSDRQPPGSDRSSRTGVKLYYMEVTLTAIGQVRPTPAAAGLDQTSAISASMEMSRAHLIVGPLSL